jgi:hypothetical protein
MSGTLLLKERGQGGDVIRLAKIAEAHTNKAKPLLRIKSNSPAE